MKKYFQIFFYILVALSFSNCETVVDIDLPTATPKLVIEANIDFNINAVNEQQMIRLSLTTDYYSQTIPKANNAEVWIESSTGEVFNFLEKAQTGEYYCDQFNVDLQKTYKLHINYNNEVYEASENLIEVPEITEVTQTITKIFNENIYQIDTYFQDHPDQENYYLVRYELAGEKNNYNVIDDKFSNGNRMSTTYFNEDLKIGNTLNIRLYGISKSYFNYMNTLLGITQGGGGPFDVPVGQVRGNVQNITNEKNYPLGYFRITQFDEASHTVFE